MFYNLLQSLTPPNWLGTLSRKFDSFDCFDYAGDLTTAGVDELAAQLKKIGVRTSMAVLKKWANAWTTTCRMHEALELPCIFGCHDCEDDLDHYLCCDPLWTIVGSCSSGQSEL